MVVIGSAGVLAPGKWRRLRALGWLAALCLALVLLFNAVARATLWLTVWAGGVHVASSNAAPASIKLVGAIAGSAALLVGYRFAVGLAESRAVPELALRKSLLDLAIGLAVGAIAMVAIVGVQWAFGWVVIEPRAIDSVALALRDSIRSGVLEETVLRLVIFRLLWRAFGVWPALIGAALVFGLLHLANPDSGLFPAACLIAGEGIGIGLYLLTGRIWAPIGMHAAWNFVQGWVFGAAVSGTVGIAGGPLALRAADGVPALLSGGGFGPEASLAALVVSLLASAVFLFLAWKRGGFVAADQPPASGQAAMAS
jgi:membrane protease YdiL (CAAX protease family)